MDGGALFWNSSYKWILDFLNKWMFIIKLLFFEYVYLQNMTDHPMGERGAYWPADFLFFFNYTLFSRMFSIIYLFCVR